MCGELGQLLLQRCNESFEFYVGWLLFNHSLILPTSESSQQRSVGLFLGVRFKVSLEQLEQNLEL